MKRLALVLAAGATSAMLLASCGGSGSPPASVGQLLTSTGTSSNVQLVFSFNFTGAGSQKAGPIARALSIKVDLASQGGKAISKSLKSLNFDVSLQVKGSTAAELRWVGSKVYVEPTWATIAKIPGLSAAEAGEMGAAGEFLGDKWFEIDPSLLSSLEKSKSVSKETSLANVAKVEEIGAIVGTYVEHLSHKKLSNGFTVSGTLKSADQALYSALHAVDPSIKKPGHEPGSFTFTVTGSGSSASGITVSVTAPNGKLGMATGTLHVAISHNGTGVSAPSGATVINEQLLQELESGG